MERTENPGPKDSSYEKIIHRSWNSAPSQEEKSGLWDAKTGSKSSFWGTSASSSSRWDDKPASASSYSRRDDKQASASSSSRWDDKPAYESSASSSSRWDDKPAHESERWSKNPNPKPSLWDDKPVIDAGYQDKMPTPVPTRYSDSAVPAPRYQASKPDPADDLDNEISVYEKKLQRLKELKEQVVQETTSIKKTFEAIPEVLAIEKPNPSMRSSRDIDMRPWTKEETNRGSASKGFEDTQKGSSRYEESGARGRFTKPNPIMGRSEIYEDEFSSSSQSRSYQKEPNKPNPMMGSSRASDTEWERPNPVFARDPGAEYSRTSLAKESTWLTDSEYQRPNPMMGSARARDTENNWTSNRQDNEYFPSTRPQETDQRPNPIMGNPKLYDKTDISYPRGQDLGYNRYNTEASSNYQAEEYRRPNPMMGGSSAQDGFGKVTSRNESSRFQNKNYSRPYPIKGASGDAPSPPRLSKDFNLGNVRNHPF